MNWRKNLSPARAQAFETVGKTYHFECPHCHYCAKVSGGADSGIHCEVQTVVCRDCRELMDVFTKVRRREGANEQIKFPGFFRPEIPPVILRDGSTVGRLVWQKFLLACPVEPKHTVAAWNNPGRCPRCGSFMEKNGFPTKIWD
jgi:transposase-like protein